MDSHRLTLGRRLKELRKENGWTLAEISERTGLAISTISKVERGQMSLTYDRFVPLAQSLGLDVGSLFSRESRSFGSDTLLVTRHGKAKRYDTSTYVYEMLAADLASKQMIPMLGKVTARSLDEFEDYVRHAGEEFLIVLSGCLRVYVEGREPVDLATGDSLYFNSGLGHAYTSMSDHDAEILVVCWQRSGSPGRPEL